MPIFLPLSNNYILELNISPSKWTSHHLINTLGFIELNTCYSTLFALFLFLNWEKMPWWNSYKNSYPYIEMCLCLKSSLFLPKPNYKIQKFKLETQSDIIRIDSVIKNNTSKFGVYFKFIIYVLSEKWKISSMFMSTSRWTRAWKALWFLPKWFLANS